MRSISIRTFSILSLLLLMLLPWVFYVTAHLLTTKSPSFDTTHAQKSEIKDMVRFIETNIENWATPIWQDDLTGKLKTFDMGVEIATESNQEIFQFLPDENHSFMRSEKFSIMQDGHIVGRVEIFHSNSNVTQIIAALTGLLLAFFMIGYMMRKHLLLPLSRMGMVVRQVAEGDLDVKLPVSPIKEITEVHSGIQHMADSLQESLLKELELEEERRFIIAAVAHDLRTPLFALRGYLDGLEKGIAHSPEKQEKYIAICKEKSAQLAHLVEDLFTFTKTEFLEMEHRKDTVDLPILLQKSIDNLNPLAIQHNISIIVSHLGVNCVILGDSYLLERAMNNLFDNAVKHTPYSGKIYVQCYKERDKVVFTIRDTGAGFSVDDIQHAFDPLYRGEASRNRSTGGAGLGLPISRRILRQHGGDLAVKNHPEGGGFIKGWIPENIPIPNDIQKKE